VGTTSPCPNGGRLANAIGRKPAMVLVALTYAVFAILSGLATSLVFLDVAASSSASRSPSRSSAMLTANLTANLIIALYS
jgi:MFS family permease